MDKKVYLKKWKIYYNPLPEKIIQGVRALEEAGFRGAVMNAVIAAYEQSAKMK